MSDRTQGSVRTGNRGDAAGSSTPEGADAAPATDQPVSATQSIPTGQNRVVQGGRPATPAVPPPATGERPAAAGGPATGAAAKGRTGKGRSGGRGPRRARLQLRHIDTWSAFKISFVLSVTLFFVWMVAVGILYGVLGTLGVPDTLNELFSQIGDSSGSGGGGDIITPGIVFGAAAVIGAINIILLTALGTVTTFIYNLCSDLVGGLELTLSERD
jgi:Transmembrane domain of unknown function (DUF3566)